MNAFSWFKPFERVGKNQHFAIGAAWLLLLAAYWGFAAGSSPLFPTPEKVAAGFLALYREGLVMHLANSLALCLEATFFAAVFSLGVVYLSPLPALAPVAQLLSKLRYLPLTGITFYLTLLAGNARTVQVSVLVTFMSLYFVTSLLAMLKDIPGEELDHARALKCSRWEVLWEVMIKGRLDYAVDILRQNLAIVWMMLVTVESLLVSAGGIGVLIKNSDRFLNHGRIVALQLVILGVGLLLDWGLNGVRKGAFPYSKF